MNQLKQRALEFYQKNETRVVLGFFVAGFLFDVFTLSEIDDPLGILQQVLYLFVAGTLLYFEVLSEKGLVRVSPRFEQAWAYRRIFFHFLLGSLLSIYSLFFLKSASFFASVIFVIVLVILMVANEVKRVQHGQGPLKVALFATCVLSFFSILSPVLAGYVGWLPTLGAVLATLIFMGVLHRQLLRRLRACVTEGSDVALNEVQNRRMLRKTITLPSAVVLVLFVIFYSVGWIPPVPLSLQEIGVYHDVERSEGNYVLSHQNPWWRFWHSGDQEFRAQPGDRIFVFARIFSPARFRDSVSLHWSYKDPQRGWQSTDRIPMNVTGGRQGGYRGFAMKQNYQPGRWRVLVETSDRREIGRLYFHVRRVPEDPSRTFLRETR
jgi:hypothetical protein